MHDVRNLITAKEGVTLEEAKKILGKARKEKLPIVDEDFNLKGLITIKDIEKQIKYPNAAKDCPGAVCSAAQASALRRMCWTVWRRWSSAMWTASSSIPHTAIPRIS
jgi:CBS-domain-containing membrane protein